MKYFLLLLIFSYSISSEQTDYSYEPDISTLTGVIQTGKAYGPPGYGEDPENDRVEDFYILKLDKKISVSRNCNEINTPERNISEIQILAVDKKIFTKLRELKNKRAKIIGKLFHSHTGHHHRDVLLEVISIEGYNYLR